MLTLVVPLVIAAAGPAAPSGCRMSQLSVSLGPLVGEATEQHTLALRTVNRGTRACVLFGYPRVSLYDATGVIPFRVRTGGDQMIAARRPEPVRVKPGRAAFLVLNKNACVGGSSRRATVLRIATPGGVKSFAFPRHMPFPYRDPDLCKDAGDVGSVITISPFVPTVRAALTG